MEMQHSRIDLVELKALLSRKLGPVLSRQYLNYLNRFLNLKISKIEFNKVCCRILGSENIALHNEFIRAILRNACSAKQPPPSRHVNDASKASTSFGNKETSSEMLYIPNGNHNNSQGLSNGDMLPLSPRKARTGFRDRRSCDRRSVLGLNGKTSLPPLHLGGKETNDLNGILEDGASIPDNIHVFEQHHQRHIPQEEDEREASAQPAAEPSEKCSRDQFGVSFKQDGKHLHAWSQLQAPLGLPFCLAHKAITMPDSSKKCVSASISGMLLDNVTLVERMEQIAASQGLEGLSVDSADILNNGLDAYLKRLISSCVKLVSARSGHEPINYKNHLTRPKILNGVRPSHLTPEYRSQYLISLQNFRVAMELNPQQLGQDWPLLLENICSRCYEE